MNARRGEILKGAGKQNGVALVVALILLVVATLIGLAASRGTMLQERMSGNTYDRSLAFQRTESALRAAEVAITANWQIATLNGIDCSPVSAAQCDIVPADTFTGTSANWIDVPGTYDVNNALTLGRSPVPDPPDRYRHRHQFLRHRRQREFGQLWRQQRPGQRCLLPGNGAQQQSNTVRRSRHRGAADHGQAPVLISARTIL